MIERRKAEVALNGIEAIIRSPGQISTPTSLEEAVELQIRAPEGSTWHLEARIADDDESPFAKLIVTLRGSRLRGPYSSDEPDEHPLCIFTGTTQDPYSLLVWLQTQGVQVRIVKIPWSDDPLDRLETWEHYRELVDSGTVVADPETDDYLRTAPPPCERGFRAKHWLLILAALAILIIAFAYFAQQ